RQIGSEPSVKRGSSSSAGSVQQAAGVLGSAREQRRAQQTATSSEWLAEEDGCFVDGMNCSKESLEDLRGV
ncbi:hypothetical protein NL676_012330, partial [Syzygium grande]